MARPLISKSSLPSRRRFVGQCASLGLVGGASASAAVALAIVEDKPLEVGLAPQLFLDDFVVERMEGLVRRFHQPCGCPIHLIQDLGTFGGLADPNRRYQIQVLVRDDTHNFAAITDGGLYFSDHVPDLVGDPRWRERLQPVWEAPRGGPRGATLRVAGYDARERIWFECTQATISLWLKRSGRNIARYTSGDRIAWSDEGLVLPVADDESDDPADFIEYMDLRASRAADLWLGQLIIFHSDRTRPQYEMPTIRNVWRKGTTETRLVASRDAGRSWSRVGGKTPWIPHHQAEDGYDRLVFTGSPVRVGDELWIYNSRSMTPNCLAFSSRDEG